MTRVDSWDSSLGCTVDFWRVCLYQMTSAQDWTNAKCGGSLYFFPMVVTKRISFSETVYGDFVENRCTWEVYPTAVRQHRRCIIKALYRSGHYRFLSFPQRRKGRCWSDIRFTASTRLASKAEGLLRIWFKRCILSRIIGSEAKITSCS